MPAIPCLGLALTLGSAASPAATIPLIGPPYSVSDKYVSISYGDTIEEAVATWWPKYQDYFDVAPYGPRQCGHEITYGGETGYARVGRVRVNNECRGSNLIYGTPFCPAGYDLVDDRCLENGEPIEDKEKPDDCTTTAHPVHFTTGTKYFYETDAPALGTSILELRRTWNSRHRRWRFDYTQRLNLAASSIRVASIERPDGSTVTFTESADGWSAQPDVTDSLQDADDGWVYTTHSGKREWYDSQGRLTNIQLSNGRRISVAYPAAGETHILDEYHNTVRLMFDKDGLVTESYDQAGERIRYAHDSRGNLTYVSFPDSTPQQAGANPFGEDNPYREYHYESATDSDLITGVTDENGRRQSTVTYDTSGRAISSGLADGSIERSNIDYSALDDTENPASVVTNALGKDTVYHLQNVFGVRRVAAVEGLASANCLADISTRVYDPSTGWLQSSLDPAGNLTTYAYYLDAGRYGLLRQRTEGADTPEQRTFMFDWDAATRQLLQQTLLDHYRVTFSYHGNGRLASRTETDLSDGIAPYPTHGRSRSWTYSYDYHDEDTQTRLNRLSIDGPRTDVSDLTVYDYTTRGFLGAVTDAAGNRTRYHDHNGHGQPTRMVDPNGVETRLHYSPRGWLVRKEVGTGNGIAATEYSRDEVGRLTGLATPAGTQFAVDYDSSGRPVALRNSRGERVEFSRDAAGNPLRIDIENSDGLLRHNFQFEFDELGRVLRNVGSHGQVVGYSYDANGNTAAIAPATGQVLHLDYDSLNRPTRLQYPDASRATFGSDEQGQLTRVTDQRELITRYFYDGLGNLKQRISPDSGSSTYAWDAAGNLLSETDARGIEARYKWDALSRLRAVQYPDNPESNVALAWDGAPGCQFCASRLREIVDASGTTSFEYDYAGRVVRRTHIVGIPQGATLDLVTSFSYDLDGNLTEVSHPNGEQVSYRRDSGGRVTTVSRQSGEERVSVMDNIDYQPSGSPSTGTYGNGLRMDRDYDLDSRLVRQSVTGVQDNSYSFDGSGNLTRIDDLVTPSRSQAFSYDLLNRLLGATGIYGEIEYDYDPVGNRTMRTVRQEGQLTSESYHYADDSNRLRSISILRSGETRQRAFIHDASGNIIEDNSGGQILRATYDTNRRIIRITPLSGETK